MKLFNFVFYFVYFSKTKMEFVVPELMLEALKCSGFRVFIPNISGMSLFSFHANINENITKSDPGKITGEARFPRDNFWVINFENTLNVGDYVNYWIFVGASGIGYRKDDLSWHVTELRDVYQNMANFCLSGVTSINNGQSTCIGKPLIDDDFSGTLDLDVWNVEHRIPTYSQPNFEFNSYENRNDTCFIKNGSLHLKPMALLNNCEVRGVLNLTEGCTSKIPRQCYYTHWSSFLLPPVKSAMVTSKISFKYGKININAKLSAGDWILPVIQLESVNRYEKPKMPKIYIVYCRGNRNLTGPFEIDIGSCLLYSGIFLHPDIPQHTEKVLRRYSKKPYNDDYHVYGLEWLPGKLKFYFDFEEYGSVDMEQDFIEEKVLSIGVAVGGIVDFPDGFVSGNYPKPWMNDERNYIKKFFTARNIWLKSWNGDDIALKIDYVKVLPV